MPTRAMLPSKPIAQPETQSKACRRAHRKAHRKVQKPSRTAAKLIQKPSRAAAKLAQKPSRAAAKRARKPIKYRQKLDNPLNAGSAYLDVYVARGQWAMATIISALTQRIYTTDNNKRRVKTAVLYSITYPNFGTMKLVRVAHAGRFAYKVVCTDKDKPNAYKFPTVFDATAFVATFPAFKEFPPGPQWYALQIDANAAQRAHDEVLAANNATTDDASPALLKAAREQAVQAVWAKDAAAASPAADAP
jgi:hypothetical protein